jgi:hypothetical protein
MAPFIPVSRNVFFLFFFDATTGETTASVYWARRRSTGRIPRLTDQIKFLLFFVFLFFFKNKK